MTPGGADDLHDGPHRWGPLEWSEYRRAFVRYCAIAPCAAWITGVADPEPAAGQGPGADDELNLFTAAARARDEAMALVERNAGEPWNLYARRWLTAYLRANELMFPDDLWAAGLVDPPNTRRALGPVLRWASMHGLMTRTSSTRPSVASHLSPGFVWRSEIYGTTGESVSPPP